MKNRIESQEIDENLLLASIKNRKRDGGITSTSEQSTHVDKTNQSVSSQSQDDEMHATKKIKEAPKENPKSKKTEGDFSSMFLKKNEIKVRQAAYVSRDLYNSVAKFLSVTSGNEISVGGYFDTVMRHHLEENKVEMNRLYKEKMNEYF